MGVCFSCICFHDRHCKKIIQFWPKIVGNLSWLFSCTFGQKKKTSLIIWSMHVFIGTTLMRQCLSFLIKSLPPRPYTSISKVKTILKIILKCPITDLKPFLISCLHAILLTKFELTDRFGRSWAGVVPANVDRQINPRMGSWSRPDWTYQPKQYRRGQHRDNTLILLNIILSRISHQ